MNIKRKKNHENSREPQKVFEVMKKISRFYLTFPERKRESTITKNSIRQKEEVEDHNKEEE